MISPKTVEGLAAKIISQPVEVAQKICHLSGLEFRVNRIDGVLLEPYCDPSVINVNTENGVVTKIENR